MMRAITQDRRIAAIAGPLHLDWRGGADTALKVTPDTPLTAVAVVTATATAGGRYILNTGTMDGRRAFFYATGTLDGPPGSWASGLPTVTGAAVAPGQRQVVMGTLGRGVPVAAIAPAISFRLEGVYGTIHRLLVWPRLLTAYEQARVRELLTVNPHL